LGGKRFTEKGKLFQGGKELLVEMTLLRTLVLTGTLGEPKLLMEVVEEEEWGEKSIETRPDRFIA